MREDRSLNEMQAIAYPSNHLIYGNYIGTGKTKKVLQGGYYGEEGLSPNKHYFPKKLSQRRMEAKR